MSGLRGRLKRLAKDAEGDRTILECPTCGEVFVLYGDPAAAYLVNLWRQDYEGGTHGPPTDPAVITVAEHEHDPSLMVDRANGLPWLGRFSAGTLGTLDDAPDLSE